jgi:hypothetical protein
MLAFLCFVKAGCMSYVGFLMFNLLEIRGRCCLSRLRCKVKGFHVFCIICIVSLGHAMYCYLPWACLMPCLIKFLLLFQKKIHTPPLFLN